MKKKFKVYVALFLLAITLIGKPIITHAAVNNNDKVTEFDYVSAPMTYEEMVNDYALSAGCSYQEALLNFPKARTMNPRASYRKLSVTLNVTTGYKPKLEFYCETSESSQYWGILSIYSVQLNRAYTNADNVTISKQFSGNIETWLRNAYTIEYIINGDFFNNGTTSVTNGLDGEIALGDYGKVTYGVSITTSSNHYKYFYKHESKRFQ